MYDPRRFGLIVYGLCCAAASITAWWIIYSYIIHPATAHAASLPTHGVGKWIQADVTAYSPYETCPKGRAENCINAAGQRPREGVSAACPRKIKKGNGFSLLGKRYICDDRTARKYDGRFDLYFENRADAIAFGKQRLTIFIYD